MNTTELKNMHIGFPRDYIALSRGFTSSHRGIDMCWNNAYGGSNAPVYAPADGTVYAVVDGKGDWMPKRDKIYRMATALDVSPAWLMAIDFADQNIDDLWIQLTPSQQEQARNYILFLISQQEHKDV